MTANGSKNGSVFQFNLLHKNFGLIASKISWWIHEQSCLENHDFSYCTRNGFFGWGFLFRKYASMHLYVGRILGQVIPFFFQILILYSHFLCFQCSCFLFMWLIIKLTNSALVSFSILSSYFYLWYASILFSVKFHITN